MLFEIKVVKAKASRNGELKHVQALSVCIWVLVYIFMNNYKKLFQKILILEEYSIIYFKSYIPSITSS